MKRFEFLEKKKLVIGLVVVVALIASVVLPRYFMIEEEEDDVQFFEILASTSTAEEIVDVLNEVNIRETSLKSWIVEDLPVKRKGSRVEILVLVASALRNKGHEVAVIRYNFKVNNKTKEDLIVVFRNPEQPKYIFLYNGVLEIAPYDKSFEDILLEEERRLERKITEYAVFEKDFENLDKPNWIKREND